MNLTEFKEKCKSDKVFIALVLILVGIGSFGLGRLSKIEALKQGISIEAPLAVANALNGQNQALNSDFKAFQPKADPPMSGNASSVTKSDTPADSGQALQNFAPQNLGGQVVASKNGTKYHFPWCSGAKTISEANKIYFNSIEEAGAAGYTPAANCKGLK